MTHNGSYLLVFKGDSSQILKLPPAHEFVIGSSPQANWSPGADAPGHLVTIDSADRARRLIPVTTVAGWEVTVNGLTVDSPQTLYSGDASPWGRSASSTMALAVSILVGPLSPQMSSESASPGDGALHPNATFTLGSYNRPR